MDSSKENQLDKMKGPVVLGAAAIATIVGVGILWQQSKSSPTATPATVAKASIAPAAMSPAPVVASLATTPVPKPVVAEPWTASERDQKKVRETARDNALKTLGQPMATFCKPEARRDLVN